jgi:hypothetical protein
VKILANFAMEFASHAYSALELSDSYVRFLSSLSRRRGCSSSALETTMLLLAGGPFLVDQSLRRRIFCQNQKESLRNFNPVDRCEAPKICLASTCHLDLDMMQ